MMMDMIMTMMMMMTIMTMMMMTIMKRMQVLVKVGGSELQTYHIGFMLMLAPTYLR